MPSTEAISDDERAWLDLVRRQPVIDDHVGERREVALAALECPRAGR
jgi:hypothetical protein